ncbi:hypothetical protein RJ639_031412 [Escallonia herrerae]|uniref:PRP8 domain-containing protein n=1 Tax=Escallonia herrerae TaxID=1293975 RepID=A0AA88X1R1_9ASTE|nr:hypothetical protein RJ639_031412 [Escallonia herrerae]
MTFEADAATFASIFGVEVGISTEDCQYRRRKWNAKTRKGTNGRLATAFSRLQQSNNMDCKRKARGQARINGVHVQSEDRAAVPAGRPHKREGGSRTAMARSAGQVESSGRSGSHCGFRASTRARRAGHLESQWNVEAPPRGPLQDAPNVAVNTGGGQLVALSALLKVSTLNDLVVEAKETRTFVLNAYDDWLGSVSCSAALSRLCLILRNLSCRQ